MTDNLRGRLREDEVYAPSWRPEVGDVLTGKVVGFDRAPAGRYGVQPIVTIEVDGQAVEAWEPGAKKPETVEPGGLVNYWLLHTTSKTSWAKAAPRVGERVGVARLDNREGANGEYAMYRVVVDRGPNEQLDLSGYLPDDEPEGDADADLPF